MEAEPAAMIASTTGIEPKNAYKYSALPSTPSIRLLKIHPGLDSTIECSLSTFEVHNLPAYIALSYTWGSPFWDYNFELSETVSDLDPPDENYTSKLRIPIVCHDESTILVTQNLYEALLELQPRLSASGKADLSMTNCDDESTVQTYIWIDAICINQDDSSERGAQVALMGDIYSSAAYVMVWLGTWLPRTQIAIDILNTLASISKESYSSMRGLSLHSASTYTTLGFRYISTSEWSVFLSFLRRRWFGRAWVQQETILAQQIVVLCGSEELEWTTIVRASQCLFDSQWCMQLSTAGLGKLVARNAPTSIPAISPASWALLRETISDARPKGLTLSQLLNASRAYGATDARDKVYSLLAIIPKVVDLLDSEFPHPDYNKEVGELYTEVAIQTIKLEGDLAFLSLVGDSSDRKLSDCPSWVPDWSTTSACGSMLAVAERNWKLTVNPPTLPPVVRDGRLLCVQGAYFDTVVACSPAIDNSSPHLRQQPRDYLHKWANWIKAAMSLKRPYPTGQNVTEVLWRTLILDTAGEQHPAPLSLHASFLDSLIVDMIYLRDQSLECYKALKDIVETLREADPAAGLPSGDAWDGMTTAALGNFIPSQMLDTILEGSTRFNTVSTPVTYSRKLLATQKGFLGCSSQSVQPGDLIWMLRGAYLPFVLRRLDNGHFLVVNEAYVHGFMHGEAIELNDLAFREIEME